MSCDYKISGEATLRRSREALDQIENLSENILGEGVEVHQSDKTTLHLVIDYDDVNSVNTPECVQGFLDAISSWVIGCAAFEITTGGESWTEWIGEGGAVLKGKSLAAVTLIEENASNLLPPELDRAIQFLRGRQRH